MKKCQSCALILALASLVFTFASKESLAQSVQGAVHDHSGAMFTCQGYFILDNGTRAPGYATVRDLGAQTVAYYLALYNGRVMDQGMGKGVVDQFGAWVQYRTYNNYDAKINVGAITDGPAAGAWGGRWQVNYLTQGWFSFCAPGR